MEECEKASHPVSREALAGKKLKIAQKVTPSTLLPKASLFDFHDYDFYIKSLNIISL